MDLLRRLQTISAILSVGLATTCAEPKFADPPPEGDPNMPGGGGGSGGPGFTIPGSGGAATPAPPGATPGSGPQCAGEAYKAETAPLDLMLLVDSSASMLEPAGEKNKWEIAQAALATFIRDARSSGLGVGLHFFPNESARGCTKDGDCVAGAVSGDYCGIRRVCVGQNASFPLRACITSGRGAGCPLGQECVAAGACSISAAECVNIGQPCPGPHGMCNARAGICKLVYPSGACEPASYQTPNVRVGVLPTAQGSLLQAIGQKYPTGGTPMGPAVRGMLAYLRTHLAANPGRKAALVLLGDGLPSECAIANDIQGISRDLAAANTGISPIPTYVIGVFSDDERVTLNVEVELSRLAAGGGTGKALVLSANNDLSQQLLAALNEIRGAALPCEYQIPAPRGGQIDYGKVNVRFTGTGGGEGIPYVETPDRCDPARGGWYYDVVPGKGATTRVLTCDATCRRFKSDQNGKVDIIYGCATQVIN